MWCKKDFRVYTYGVQKGLVGLRMLCLYVCMTLLDGKTGWRYNPKFSLGDTLESPIWNDARLTAKAKGVWAYMKSKPHGWDFAASRMASQFKDETKSIQRAMKELVTCGYLKGTKLKTGRISYVIVDEPWVGIEPEIQPSPIGKAHVFLDEPKKDIKGSTANAVEALMLAYSAHEVSYEQAKVVVGDRVFSSYDDILKWMEEDRKRIDDDLEIGESVPF